MPEYYRTDGALTRALLKILEERGPILWYDLHPHLLALRVHSSAHTVRQTLRHLQRDYRVVLDGHLAMLPAQSPRSTPIDIFS
jgi:hypothetical protein